MGALVIRQFTNSTFFFCSGMFLVTAAIMTKFIVIPDNSLKYVNFEDIEQIGPLIEKEEEPESYCQAVKETMNMMCSTKMMYVNLQNLLTGVHIAFYATLLIEIERLSM